MTFDFDLTLSNEKHYDIRHVSRYDVLKIENSVEKNFVFQDCRYDLKVKV